MLQPQPGRFKIYEAPHKAKLTKDGVESTQFGAGGRTDTFLAWTSRLTTFVLEAYVTTNWGMGTFDPKDDQAWDRLVHTRVLVEMVPKTKLTVPVRGALDYAWKQVVMTAKEMRTNRTIAGVHGNRRRVTCRRVLSQSPFLAAVAVRIAEYLP